ncbi:cell division protein SepF [Actinomadura roseirufa]|uniref:cell division protein SepF n=1 Tax=Actinomadura roseirufa TaxID=2094049 RepID=UPI00104106EF|nr:cell division protein SepF [Actinomadura roseirufa]
MIVETVRPRGYDEVRQVGQYFREGVVVLMDLESVADDEAQQLVDFAAGLICGRGGELERLSPTLFLLIPPVPARSGARTSVVKKLCPRDYTEALYVGHYFRKGLPVVMDLTAMSEDEARQLVDFAAGLICGRGGDLERLSPKVFLLVPAWTDGTGGKGRPERPSA